MRRTFPTDLLTSWVPWLHVTSPRLSQVTSPRLSLVISTPLSLFSQPTPFFPTLQTFPHFLVLRGTNKIFSNFFIFLLACASNKNHTHTHANTRTHAHANRHIWKHTQSHTRNTPTNMHTHTWMKTHLSENTQKHTQKHVHTDAHNWFVETGVFWQTRGDLCSKWLMVVRLD